MEKDVYLLLQVHDELIYEIKKSKVKKVSAEIKRIMENVVDPKKIEGIPLTVDVLAGENWGEVKEI